ncbi:polysaccharide pyruvyl transferase CsaB [Paenibacillus odorifer]|uniref:polysaccharide pyruvyl transferase CsaB n=1 Tax=Paenibacillus odorifer TaxID=189426 RepID=UPI00096CAFEB|nr:polysaccharide pyruvyl transferase CsaB [Paenibacillus odorifer]OMD97810.1 polysaccharide pyruvyl transferase CsaB [Paenibacillus odorifer]
MVATPKKIVISGYYGFHNSGDEAVLQSILIALQQHAQAAGIEIEPIVLSIDPEWTSATYGVKSVHRMKLVEVRQAIYESSGLISGGGSLLQDVTGSKSIPYYLGIIKLAQWMGKPTFIYAQGIGPVNRKLFHPLIKSVFRKCTYISVRDEQSRELLLSMGLEQKNIEVVPDPVMGLSLPEDTDAAELPESSDSLPVVGISVRYWEQDHKELNALAQGLIKANLEKPLHLRFLPFHLPSDIEASRYVMEKLEENISQHGGQVSICEDASHPQHMLREVGQCEVLIGMRLHSLIYAAGRRVPLIGISYDPKIDHFLDRVRCQPVGTTQSLDAGQVAAEIGHLLETAEGWRNERETILSSLIQEAGAPARQIVEYFHHKG